jgi:purine-binding chemotaxis protein CheW
VGACNLRGRIVPVIDLHLRFGQQRPPYRTTDVLVVLENGESAFGIIASGVQEVTQVVEEALPAGDRQSDAGGRFIRGLARLNEQLVMLLDVERLLGPGELPVAGDARQTTADDGRQTADGEGSLSSSVLRPPSSVPSTGEGSFSPEATPEERAIFRRRAQDLAPPMEQEESDGLASLAVVTLNGECYGIDLGLVREFAPLRSVTPVPCCPAHVVGQMNLRGDIITLVDVRGALEMPLEEAGDSRQVVVIAAGELVAGVLVDAMVDVFSLRPADVASVPAAVRAPAAEYLAGTAPYREKMLGILDLQALLTGGRLVVREEP